MRPYRVERYDPDNIINDSIHVAPANSCLTIHITAHRSIILLFVNYVYLLYEPTHFNMGSIKMAAHLSHLTMCKREENL